MSDSGIQSREIASFRVFMCQVIDTAAILILAVQLRIVRQPVLYRAADDGRRVDTAVGFGNDASVNRAGFVVRRGAVVFHRLTHDDDLLRREPLPQFCIRSEISPEWIWCISRPFSVPRRGRPQLRKPSADRPGNAGPVPTLFDDRPGVFGSVGTVEMFVTRGGSPVST